MRRISETARRRIEMQGFIGLDDEYLAEIEPWLRLSPAICTTWAAVATGAGSAPALFALVPFAVGGALLRNHPFDVIYNHGLRHLLKTRPLPRYGAPRRFACAFGSVWVAMTATAFAMGWTNVGLALGAVMVVMASIQVLTGFCVPSFTYQRVLARRSRRPATV